MTKFEFSNADIETCLRFANASDREYYGRRNQHNNDVKRRQIYIGKLGELAASRYLRDVCPDSVPDFAIYEAKKKSWNSDLGCNSYHFHVKSMGVEQAKLYGLSWTFQFSNARGRGGKDAEIFAAEQSDRTFVVLVQVDLGKHEAEVITTIQARKLSEHNLFRDPKLDHLKGIKKVVYFEDLLKKNLVGLTDHLPINPSEITHK